MRYMKQRILKQCVIPLVTKGVRSDVGKMRCFCLTKMTLVDLFLDTEVCSVYDPEHRKKFSYINPFFNGKCQYERFRDTRSNMLSN